MLGDVSEANKPNEGRARARWADAYERANQLCPAHCAVYAFSSVLLSGTLASECLPNICNKNAVAERTLTDKSLVSEAIVHLTFLLLLTVVAPYLRNNSFFVSLWLPVCRR